MPGYRDRVVTIYHTQKEGGMNLNMPAGLVTKLAERGKAGAGKLVARFAGEQAGAGVVPSNGWDNQRWIRFRTATSGLSRWLTAFRDGYTSPAGNGTPYAQLAGLHAMADPPSYSVPDQYRQVVNSRTSALLSIAQQWEEPPQDAFTANAPSDKTHLSIEPIFGSA